MSRARSIAVAQTIPRRGDVEANLDAHLRLARTAADEGARLVVFPELSLTGYELDLADELAFSENDARLAPLLALATSSRLTLVAGAPVRLGARLHIGAFIISPDGSVDVYTKRRLGAFSSDANPGGSVPPAEATVFLAGSRSPLLRFDGHTAALAICADVGRPAFAREAAERGAKTYLASMFVIPGELEQEVARLASYAVQHSLAVAMANYGGPSGGLDSAGASAIWSEQGELLAKLAGTGPGIVVASESAAGWRAKALPLRGS